MQRTPAISRFLQATVVGLIALAVAPTAFSAEAQARPSPQAALAAAMIAPLFEPSEQRTPRRGRRMRRDTDGDGLPNWIEVKRTRTNPRRRDTDRDGLSDWVEVKRTRTNPRRRDTDRDGLSDWTELRRTRTNPRRADSDGDGFGDAVEVRAGSNPRDPASMPAGPSAQLPLAPDPIPGPEPTSEPPPPPDTTPPTVQIDSGPDGLTNNPTPSFAFSGEAGASFACSIDQGTPDFGPCSGASTHSPDEALADGEYSFRVRATDAAGNQASAMRSFEVDATAPETSIDSHPPALTNSDEAAFGLSGTDRGGSGVASFECKLDGGAFSACGSPREYAGLSDGSHTFEVRSIDNASNADSTPASFEWTVNTTPPTVQVDSGPDGLTNDPTPSFAFSGEAGASFACSIDQGTPDFGLCSGAGSHTPGAALSDGEYTFRVRATDAAGNQASAARGFEIDATAPDTAIDTKPPTLTSSDEAAFGFSGTDPGGSGVASFECQLDGGGFALCTSGVEYTGLSEGLHEFEVRAIDQAGNTDGSPASFAWTVDTTPPAVQVDSGPDGLTNDPTPSFAFSGEAGVSFECSIDQGTPDFGPCSGASTHSPDEALADGEFAFRVRAADPAGNQATASRGFELDATAPDTQIDTKPPALANKDEAGFGFSGTDPGGYGVASFECRRDGGSWAICTSPKQYAGLSDGSHSFEVRATDAAGNTDGSPASFEWTVDTQAPETQIDAKPSALVNAATATFGFSGTDPGSSGIDSFECKLDEASFALCTSGVEYTSLDDGPHEFTVRAIDQAGNVDSSPASFEWTVDTTPPTVQVDSGPDGLTNNPTPSFAFSGEAGASFACSIDQGTPDFGPCSGPDSHTSGEALADGEYTFRVRATDAAGNQASATRSFELDATAPETQIDAKPATLVDSEEAAFGFSGADPGGSGVASFECRRNGGSWVECTSPREYAGLSDGVHLFEVRAIDVAGNADASPASFEWIVDTTPPTVQVDSGPDGLTNDPTPSFAFSGEAGASFACSIDGGTPDFGPCSGPGSHTPGEALADGEYTFRVRATDAAGNQASATRRFELDTALPDAPELSGTDPASPANANDPQLLGSAPADTTVRLYVGGACSGTPLAIVTSAELEAGIGVSIADDSTTSFRATATTAAENTSGCSEALVYVEDSSAPETQIDAKPNALTNSDEAAFGFSGTDPGGSGVASFECKLDSSSWVECTSPRQNAGLGDGSHVFEVRAIDVAGNTDGSPASFEWSVDTTPPTVQIDSGPDGLTNDPTPSFGFSGEAGASFDCSIDQGTRDFGPCSDAESHTPGSALADGKYTFRVRATDAAGNQATATRGFELDATAPDTAIDTKPPALINSDEAEFGFSGTDPGGSGVASFECRRDGGSWAICTSPKQYAGLSDGSHTFEVRATDAAGNTDGSPDSFEWSIDTQAPETQIDAKPPALVNAAAATFGFSGTDPGGSGVASFECKLDGGGFTACVTGVEYTSLDDGLHEFEVRAIDQAGNIDGSPASFEWSVDTQPPETTVDSHPPALTSSNQASFGFSGADPGGSGVASFQCRRDGGSWKTCTSPRQYTGLVDGSHIFEVRAIDSAANTDGSPASFTWAVDATAPQTQIDAQPPAPTNSDEAAFGFSGTDSGGSGVASFECKLDGGGFSACSAPHEYAGLSDGSHVFEVRAIDVAGNTDGSPASFEWTVDTTPPAVQIDSGPDGLTNDPTPSFAFSGEAGASFECSIDGGTPDFGPCSGPGSHTPGAALPDGEYTFRVRAADAAGNQASATRSFEIDTALPDAPELSGTDPASPANANDPQLLGSAPADTTVRLYVGGACSGAAIATVTAAELEAGFGVSVADDSTTSFRATATTPAENTSGCSEALLYVEDSSDPETTVDTHPPALTNSDEAAFGFSGTDSGGSGVASFECQLDSGGFGACTSPKQYAGLGDGAHRFEVRAIDNAGNTDASPASFEWTVDTTPPALAIDSLSKALVKEGQTSEITWHANENGVFELRVGGASCDAGTVVGSGTYSNQPNAQVSTVSAAKLAEGANTLRLCLSDAAGNRTAVMTTVSKDSDAPDTTIETQPPAFTTDMVATFVFSGDDGAGSGVAGFECRRDGGTWLTCTSPKSYTELPEGAHEFEVKAVDGAGNRDPIPASVNWTVDTTAPVVQIESGPDGLTNKPTPTFGFGSEPGVGFECSIDDGTPAFGPCSSPTSHTPASPLAEGPHTFRVRATDQAANQATASREFEVDTTAPTAPEFAGTVPASPANENTPVLVGVATAGAIVDIYAGPTCSGSPLVTVSPAELEAGIEVTVADDSTTVFRATTTVAERTSGCAEPLTYVEDSTAPATTVSASPPATTYSTSASFFFAADEPGASFECSLDAAPYAACSSPQSFAELPVGAHTFSIRATDAAGNLEAAPAELSWTIESPPSPFACAGSGVEATTASQVRTAVQSNQDVCVTAALGNVDLSNLGARPVVVSSEGGSMSEIDLASTTDLTISRARFRSIELRNSHRTRLLGNTIGGTQAERVADQLIFMPVRNDDVVIEGNEIGWTLADDSGNTGYGCRCYGDLNRLRFVGNRLHDLAADGFQGVGGTDVTIDRNEIGPVGRNPESDEHSDNIQITGNEANLRITNNWLHHQGYYEGAVTANSGSTYIHGGSDGSLVYENNLIETAQGRTEICGLGSGGESRSNITIRRNTWVEGGLAFSGFPGLEWDCDAGAGNSVERNVAVDADGGFQMHGTPESAAFAANLWGQPSLVTLDTAGNCTSANCNPAGEEPIGYRKPTGVAW